MHAPAILLSVGLMLGACASSRPSVGPPSGGESAASTELSASIARVEQGLIPEVRFVGERTGWSIEDRLRRFHTPGVTIAVIHDYRVAWAKAYGVMDLGTGEHASAETLFQAASVSKMVTAMAALQAVEAGQVSLDADINQGLRSWKLPDNELTRATPVTLTQLLSHTAGINVRAVPGYPLGAPLPTLHQILEGQPPAQNAPVRVEHPPGKEFGYSGGGSLIVQQLVVDLSGRPFATALRDAVFTPLGLGHSTFELAPARTALAYDFDGRALPITVNPESSAAGLWTTPSDLARFLVEIQLGLQGRSKVVSRQLATRMTTPVVSIGVPDVSTGLGTFVERHGATTWFGHDGRNDGFLAIARASTTGGEGAVVMTNGVGGAPLLLEILRSIAVEYAWDGWLEPPQKRVQLEPAQLAALAGRYSAGVDRSVTIVVKGNALEAREPLREPLELVPLDVHTFVSRPDNARFTFQPGDLLVKQPHEGEPVLMARISEDMVEPLRLLEAGRQDEALARYRELLATHPDNPAVAESRFDELGAELCEQRLDFERALRVFAIAVALYPESVNANAALAIAWLRAGRRDQAAPFQARALALLPHDTRGPELERLLRDMRIAKMKELAAPPR